MNLNRRFFAAGSLAALCWPSMATADDKFPSRPIRFIVPAPPGALSDSIPRLIANEMSTAMNSQVVVENRPGAGGTVGTAALLSRPADGYGLVIGTTGSMAFNTVLMPTQPYDTRKDLVGVAQAAVSPLYLVVKADSPHRSLADLVRAAKAAPGQLAYGTIGNGSTSAIAGALLAKDMGLQLIDVPFAGYPPAITELLGGRMAFLFVDGSSANRIEEGQLRALGVTTARRSARLPNVPTLKEQGANIDLATWFGVYARAGTPPEILARLRSEVRRAIERPAYQQQMTQFGVEPGTVFGEDFQRFHLAEIERWTKVLPTLGLKPAS
ncbi:MAG TPA: tripartite tricarboxylate transporter substrate binding protein [Ramlibacter sp.]|nr:tripartite tricarboxylate transporter substrate binding protein [Ramlibacter sp.]